MGIACSCFDSRARSTKTRIETPRRQGARPLLQIREQDPLKQGLKPHSTASREGKKQIREQDPLKQGLKHVYDTYIAEVVIIREQDPLKQGLKRRTNR